jgi:3-hydroxyisobutyrate dehydrogenase-like beta-hydroxyacid dehydrogenase
MPVIAVIAPGAMGAAVGARLVEHGAEVWTVLAGRSPASAARAKAAGMMDVDAQQVSAADIVLSIVPPGEALALARSLSPVLREAARKPVYADCNAVSPQTVAAIAAEVDAAGVRFVDAGIIGGPPKPGTPGPLIYTSGPHAPALAMLAQHGLRVSDLHGPVGAASGLKMSYAGITKGLTALASAMMLAATRFGAAPALAAELAASQPDLLKHLTRSVPDMYPKAYRWVAEMQEIAAFAGEDAPTRDIYTAIAALYAGLAQDAAGPKQEVGALDAFLGRP